jgi:hypothetical protein
MASEPKQTHERICCTSSIHWSEDFSRTTLLYYEYIYLEVHKVHNTTITIKRSWTKIFFFMCANRVQCECEDLTFRISADQQQLVEYIFGQNALQCIQYTADTSLWKRSNYFDIQKKKNMFQYKRCKVSMVSYKYLHCLYLVYFWKYLPANFEIHV